MQTTKHVSSSLKQRKPRAAGGDNMPFSRKARSHRRVLPVRVVHHAGKCTPVAAIFTHRHDLQCNVHHAIDRCAPCVHHQQRMSKEEQPCTGAKHDRFLPLLVCNNANPAFRANLPNLKHDVHITKVLFTIRAPQLLATLLKAAAAAVSSSSTTPSALTVK